MSEVYAVDIVNDLVGRISGAPTRFERDGKFYIASQEGFGQVRYAPHDALGEAISFTTRIDPLTKREMPVFTTSTIDTLFFASLIKYAGVSLDSMANIARKQLTYDHWIRILRHALKGGGSYGSDYATESPESVVECCRSASKEEYFRSIRERESEILTNMVGEAASGKQYSAYPDCAVFTKNMMISFPRPLDTDRWGGSSRIPIYTTGDLAVINDTKSPFAVYIILNGELNRIQTHDDLTTRWTAKSAGFTKDIMALQSVMGDIEKFVSKLNEFHDVALEKRNAKKK